MSSLLSQVIDPAFIFKAVYHNVAKLVNRRILTTTPGTLTITQKVSIRHFPILEKLSQLFFETQKLSTPTYALLPDTPVANLKKYLIGFTEQSLNLSMSYIYLISCETRSSRPRTSLINTMSKLVEDTQINKTHAAIQDKEMHGLWLALSSVLKSL